MLLDRYFKLYIRVGLIYSSRCAILEKPAGRTVGVVLNLSSTPLRSGLIRIRHHDSNGKETRRPAYRAGA